MSNLNKAIIMSEIQAFGSITPTRAASLIGYHANGLKHAGAMLSRMAKAGLIQRRRHGVYTLPTLK